MLIQNRLGPLIYRLESGESVTQKELRRTVLLQSLDAAKLGEDYARQAIDRERWRTEDFRKCLEAACPTAS